jgi:hypothetical protein
MKKVLLFGALALVVGCTQTMPTANNVKPTKAPLMVLPATVNLSQTVLIPADQIKGGNTYQVMQRSRGGMMGGRMGGFGRIGGFGRFSRMGGRFFRDRDDRFRFRNRFFGFGSSFFPLYDYAGAYYPDYFDPYTYGAGGYSPLYANPLCNYPSYASPYSSYALPYATPYAAPGCCVPGMTQQIAPVDGTALGY